MRDEDGRCALIGSRSVNRQTWLTLGVGALVGAAAFSRRARGDRDGIVCRPPGSAPGRTARRQPARAAGSDHAVREAGRVSVVGVYGGFHDRVTLGAPMEEELQARTGQTHVQRCAKELLRRIQDGEIDTTFLISHRLPLEETATGYDDFENKQNESTKVVLKPGATVA